MHNRTISFALAALLWGAALPAAAQEAFVPDITFPATHSQIGTRAIDILDLVPGMTPDAVQSALSALHGADSVVPRPTFFEAGSRGVTVRTAEFLSTMRAGSDDDRIEITFTGPASANQAFAIKRRVQYPDVLSAPGVETIIDALIAKYGPPSMDDSRDHRVTVNYPAKLVWGYAGDQQLPCRSLSSGSGVSCPFLNTGYEPRFLESYAREDLDFDVVITANITPHRADETRTASFTIEVSDLRRRQLAARADVDAIQAELERVHEQASRPAAVPAL